MQIKQMNTQKDLAQALGIINNYQRHNNKTSILSAYHENQQR